MSQYAAPPPRRPPPSPGSMRSYLGSPVSSPHPDAALEDMTWRVRRLESPSQAHSFSSTGHISPARGVSYYPPPSTNASPLGQTSSTPTARLGSSYAPLGRAQSDLYRSPLLDRYYLHSAQEKQQNHLSPPSALPPVRPAPSPPVRQAPAAPSPFSSSAMIHGNGTPVPLSRQSSSTAIMQIDPEMVRQCTRRQLSLDSIERLFATVANSADAESGLRQYEKLLSAVAVGMSLSQRVSTEEEIVALCRRIGYPQWRFLLLRFYNFVWQKIRNMEPLPEPLHREGEPFVWGQVDISCDPFLATLDSLERTPGTPASALPVQMQLDESHRALSTSSTSLEQAIAARQAAAERERAQRAEAEEKARREQLLEEERRAMASKHVKNEASAQTEDATRPMGVAMAIDKLLKRGSTASTSDSPQKQSSQQPSTTASLLIPRRSSGDSESSAQVSSTPQAQSQQQQSSLVMTPSSLSSASTGFSKDGAKSAQEALPFDAPQNISSKNPLEVPTLPKTLQTSSLLDQVYRTTLAARRS